ncbi:MAG: hypothetical protein MK102_17045 [Fuerstiella sp.]|nr:hypothetical protein [Fuerstiella sp.]
MLKGRSILAALLLMTSLSSAHGQKYSMEPINAPPEADAVSEELRKKFATEGIRIKRGTRRTVCEIWFCNEWSVDAEFKPTNERLYPFSPGQLIGLLHFTRRGSDFRDQTVKRGWYTLRFALQPVDGNHEGTSPTRDFLVMVGAENDAPDREWDLMDLMTTSAQAAGSTHPAMMCLQRSTEDSATTIRHEESNDWWILHVVGNGTDTDRTESVPVDLIVAGHATE